jgi:hypothetical protein
LTHDGRSLQYPPRLTGASFWNDVTCFAGKSAPSQTGDIQFRDPLLKPLAAYGGLTMTMAIPADSPARDAGSGCPPTDQRGVARPQLNACDLGAFELQVFLVATPSLLARNQLPPPLILHGVDFSNATQAFIDGQPRSTTFLDSQRLRLTLTMTDVADLGPLTVTLSGPGSAVGSTQVQVVEAVYSIYVPQISR